VHQLYWATGLPLGKEKTFDIYFTPFTRTNSRRITGLRVTAMTIKFLEENRGISLQMWGSKTILRGS
jgi:hypothetical protein